MLVILFKILWGTFNGTNEPILGYITISYQPQFQVELAVLLYYFILSYFGEFNKKKNSTHISAVT